MTQYMQYNMPFLLYHIQFRPQTLVKSAFCNEVDKTTYSKYIDAVVAE